MTSILYTLADMTEIETGVLDFGAIRMRVGPNDRDAAQFLIGFIDEAVQRKSTYADGELVLLLKLATAINDIPIDRLPEEAIEDHDVQVALNSLFWFNFVTALHDIDQPPRLDIRSAWVSRPRPYTYGAPAWHTVGITVDEMIGHKVRMWAIKAGDDSVLGKDGEWELQPMPSSRTKEFFARTRWDSFEAAYAFAQAYLAKQEATPNVEL